MWCTKKIRENSVQRLKEGGNGEIVVRVSVGSFRNSELLLIGFKSMDW